MSQPYVSARLTVRNSKTRVAEFLRNGTLRYPCAQHLQTKLRGAGLYCLSAALSAAAMSFFSSSGVSLGRSKAIVSLLILPVNLNGTW